MPRYDERELDLVDLVGRFEGESSATHVRNALASIGRLERYGESLWDEGSEQLLRWRKGCETLSEFLNRLGERRSGRKDDLATAFRKFIHEFEHSTGRMYQMLHSLPDDSDPAAKRCLILRWIDLVYRFSSYAVVSFWIDDKAEKNSAHITINLSTGESATDLKHEPMSVPRRYRPTTRPI